MQSVAQALSCGCRDGVVRCARHEWTDLERYLFGVLVKVKTFSDDVILAGWCQEAIEKARQARHRL